MTHSEGVFIWGGKQKKFCTSITFCRPGQTGKKYEAKNSDDPAPSAFVSGSFDFSTIVSNSVQKCRKKQLFKKIKAAPTYGERRGRK